MLDGLIIGVEEFASLMAPLEPGNCLAVAVSGGADSLALCVLADEWARNRGGQVIALTVDHGLREESYEEAQSVGKTLNNLSIRHEILRWEGKKPSANIQAEARKARYNLMFTWCREHETDCLLVGHNLEDQAETFLLRLARGSGVDGLAAIMQVSSRMGVRILRPLISVSRQRLEASLQWRGLAWIDDPSNDSDHFRRTRFRKIMPILAGEGLTSSRLGKTAARMGRARAALEIMVQELAKRSVEVFPEGYCLLDFPEWRQAPEEISLRLLANLLRMIGGNEFTSRIERLEHLHKFLYIGSIGKKTLSGCVILRGGDKIMICREAGRIKSKEQLEEKNELLWDNRFFMSMSNCAGLSLGALGRAGLAQIAKEIKPLSLSDEILASLPSLRRDEQLVAVPHIGYKIPDELCCVDTMSFSPIFAVVGAINLTSSPFPKRKALLPRNLPTL